jgi:hypothetical protein
MEPVKAVLRSALAEAAATESYAYPLRCKRRRDSLGLLILGKPFRDLLGRNRYSESNAGDTLGAIQCPWTDPPVYANGRADSARPSVQKVCIGTRHG